MLQDTVTQMTMVALAVVLIVYIVTASLRATLLVMVSVALVTLFMTAASQAIGLPLNQILSVNVTFAMGISLDYSSHIAHGYLSTRIPPQLCTNDQEKRDYKARKALSRMGSSVFHGANSTFIAIVSLLSAKCYSILVTAQCWFFIISFGVLNAFVLLPVLLSLFGPLTESQHEDKAD